MQRTNREQQTKKHFQKEYNADRKRPEHQFVSLNTKHQKPEIRQSQTQNQERSI
jgi:hypothetical protein